LPAEITEYIQNIPKYGVSNETIERAAEGLKKPFLKTRQVNAEKILKSFRDLMEKAISRHNLCGKVRRLYLAARHRQTRGAEVIDDQTVMGDFVALPGVIPEIAHVLDKLAGVINRDIVDGDDPVVAKTGIGIFLQLCDTLEVQGLLISLGLRDHRLRHDRSAVATNWRLMAGTFFLWVMIKPVRYSAKWRRSGSFANNGGKLREYLFDDFRKLYNSRHRAIRPETWNQLAIGTCRQNAYCPANLSALQKSGTR